MTSKHIVTTVLLLFVAVSLVYIVTSEPPQEAEIKEADAQEGHKLIAYYFHRTKRCRTCLTIQTYAEDALKEAFPEAMKTGELEWRLVNVEEPANEHFVTDYQLTTSEIVLVDTNDGQQTEWRNLKRIWDLVGDELEFKAYVEGEAMMFLEQDS